MSDYFNDIRRVNDPRTMKFRNSYYIRDYHRHYTKTTKHRISEKDYRAIIYELYHEFIDELNNENTIPLPNKMGFFKTEVLKNEVASQSLIAWKTTLQIWEEDEEFRTKKKLIYEEVPAVRILLYCKRKNCYKNHMYIKFMALRPLKKSINGKLKDYQIKPLKYG